MTFARKQKGFSILEGLIALLLLATAGTALLQAMQSQLNLVYKLQNEDLTYASLLSAYDYIEMELLAGKTEGNLQLEQVDITWKADEALPWVRSTNQLGIAVNYEVALFDIAIDISVPDRAFTKSLSTQLTVHRQG